MSRELKFRAWDKVNKKMVNLSEVYDIFGRRLQGTNGNYPLMQYTGLKDKNGKELFEGDLVKWTDEFGVNPNLFKVQYEEAQWVIAPITESVMGWYLGEKELEIIGNIYENPELLEEKSTPN